mmetsp:Transcript_20838/g.29134  ORF Transcript_20838/g.29134 Transcript_20838/m.29134 type:complete len:83 (+) Transcript_20838:667-915(+)
MQSLSEEGVRDLMTWKPRLVGRSGREWISLPLRRKAARQNKNTQMSPRPLIHHLTPGVLAVLHLMNPFEGLEQIQAIDLNLN